MSAPAKEAPKPGTEAAKADAKSGTPSPAPGAAPAGGIKALLPLILAVVLMPVLAYVMTMFVLLPKLQKATGGAAAAGHTESSSDAGHEKAEPAAKHGEAKAGGEKHGASDATAVSHRAIPRHATLAVCTDTL